MQVARYFCFLFIFVFVTNLTAADKEKIAVVEFKNKSESPLSFSGSDLAAWLSNELKRKDRFEPVDRKAVSKIVKDADWNEDRLSEDGESKLREIPAKYAVYGSLVNWKSSVSTTDVEVTADRRLPSVASVYVLFYMDLVDLQTGKSVETFRVDGDAMTLDTPTTSEGRASRDLQIFDETYKEACKTAMRRAAIKLSEE
jgi:hypothetical protein